jgi:coenzyme PQQ synthesis protein D (PqqD)
VFERAPRVLFEVVDGQAVLLDAAGTRLITLNRTGSLVWDALEQPTEFSAVVDRVAGQVDADRDVLTEDVGRFLGELEEVGLVLHDHARRNT